MQRRNRFAMTEPSTPLEARVLLAANQIKSFDHTLALRSLLPSLVAGVDYVDLRINIDKSQIVGNQLKPKDFDNFFLGKVEEGIRQIHAPAFASVNYLAGEVNRIVADVNSNAIVDVQILGYRQ